MNPVADNTAPVLKIKGWPIGIKDNIPAIKAVRLCIYKFLLLYIPNVEKTDFLRFLLRDEEKTLRKTVLDFITQKRCYEVTIILNISHVKPIKLTYNCVLKNCLFPINSSTQF